MDREAGPDICSAGHSVFKGDQKGMELDSEKIGSRKPSEDDSILKPSLPNQKDSGICKQEDWLASTKTQMGEVREENERLKKKLARIVNDYHSLQMQFYNNVQEEQARKPANEASITSTQETDREQDLVCLSLGTSSSGKKKEEKITAYSSDEEDEEDAQLKEALSLRLQYSSRRFEDEVDYGGPIKVASTNPSSPQNSTEGGKKVESGEAWSQQPAASRSRKLAAVENGDDEVSHQPAAKKARVSVRARCDTPTMNDGCQWRKYGQKIAKGNPCPRAYYRCTVSPGCPVKKQVQRCAEDMSILITTYEGTHNHPLPVSATAMASTTSAAASMLMSGSSTSQTTTHQETLFPVATTTFSGLNLSFTDNSRPKQFYHQSNPSTLLPPSTSHPTITLDLTSTPPRFNTFSSNLTSTINPRYPSPGGFSFSSSESTTLPTSWSSGYLSGGTHAYKQNPTVPSLLGRPSQGHSYFQKSNTSPPPHQQLLIDQSSVVEATKAIASDPNFRSALMTAIASIVSSAQGSQQGGDRENFKWGETFSPKSAITRENGCAPTYFK